jgi:hypothetical protein
MAFELVQFNWRKAKTALERAREIHIIGYSLPDADVAFHNLVASVRSGWSEAPAVEPQVVYRAVGGHQKR